MFTLETELRLPLPPDELFPFFSDARNLERLTPPLLRFRVVTPEPIELRAGTRIDYRLTVRGVPLRWKSEITAWEPPHRFVDEQLRGPYKTWIHEHTFVADGGGTLAIDRVRYDHFGGRLINRWIVAPDLRRIFAYRQQMLRELFGGTP